MKLRRRVNRQGLPDPRSKDQPFACDAPEMGQYAVGSRFAGRVRACAPRGRFLVGGKVVSRGRVSRAAAMRRNGPKARYAGSPFTVAIRPNAVKISTPVLGTPQDEVYRNALMALNTAASAAFGSAGALRLEGNPINLVLGVDAGDEARVATLAAAALRDQGFDVVEPGVAPRVRVRTREISGPTWPRRREIDSHRWHPHEPEMDGPTWPVTLADVIDFNSPEWARWSDFQKDIFREIMYGHGNIVVRARAGSGKTTTILEALKLIPKDKRILLCAYNKNIKDELKSRAPNHVDVMTLHGYGFRLLRQAWNRGDYRIQMAESDAKQKQVDRARMNAAMDFANVPPPVFPGTMVEGPDGKKYDVYNDGWNDVRTQVAKLVSMCKGFLAHDPQSISDVNADFRFLVGEYGENWAFYDARYGISYSLDDVAKWVVKCMDFALEKPKDGYITFDDMVFVPAFMDRMVPTHPYDFVVIDETQDLSPARLKLAIKAVRAKVGRIVAVGDDFQSIYRFSGADTQAIPRLTRELNAKVLPLSESFRISECAMEEARKVVPDLTVPRGTPRGICQDIKAIDMMRNWRDGDIVISRTNEPLMPLCLAAVADGKRALALGKADVVRELKSVFQSLSRRSRTNDTQELLKSLEVWGDAEEAKMYEEHERAREREEKRTGRPVPNETPANAVQFRYGIDALAAILKKSETVNDVSAHIDALSPFTREQVEKMSAEAKRSITIGRLVFTTTHQFKGGEANRVWVLEETFRYNRDGLVGWMNEKTDAEKNEERNLWYVAITRAANMKAEPAKGLPARPAELYFVYDLKGALGSGAKR